jgi:S-DNA-T family DNA segregation ATPase FtsK/SpoIIIE
MTERPHIFRWILIFVAFASWVFLLLSCGSFSSGDWPSHDVYPYPPVRNLCGPVGSLLAYYCFMVVGQGIYPILLFAGVCLVLMCVKGRVADLWLRAIGLAVLSVAFAAALHQLHPGSPDGFPEGNGGLLGIAAGKFLMQHFNNAGAMLVLLTSFLVGLLLAADELVLRAPKVAVETYGKVQEKSSSFGFQLPNFVPRFIRRPSDSETTETGEETSGGTATATLKPGPLQVQGGSATGLFDEDNLAADDKKVLLNKHNLGLDELELTYAHDHEHPAEALKRVDPGPAEAVDIPPTPVTEKVEPVINNLAPAALPAPGQGTAIAVPPATPSASASEAGSATSTSEVPSEGEAKPAAPPSGEIVVRNAAAARARVSEAPPPPKELGDYRLPGWDFLADAEHGYAEQQEKYVREKADVLTQTLREFGIDATVVAIDTGPVITMYELMIPSGMKVASITQLTNDIRRALKAVGEIRIVAPVPGKDTVGIEVPNPQKEKVRLKDLFALAPDARNKMAIPIYLGKDASGEALVTDLTKMPHCLIAGTTGSGKSVCINTIVMSIMYHQRPDHVKLILIDPKVVELKPFSEIPHLMCPPINDPNKAPSVLEWLCTKMDERYELLAEAGVRQIGDYNKLTREQLVEIFQPASPEEEAKIPKFMPYIVVVIDELADLMMQSGKEVEASIVRLAQKSRAVGIHVILATQRPQANVVTGLIKSNMPSRIAFRVQSRMDSRIVLDQNGAELLLGQGDMLFLPPGAAKPIRSQGTFIDDIEVRQSVKLVKGLAEAQYEPELVQIRQVRGDAEFEHDDLYDDAVKVVIETKRGSVSLLQRRLSIGYARASRLIERMAATGILGEYKGSQSREVMFTLEEWEAAKAAMQKDKDEGMTV